MNFTNFATVESITKGYSGHIVLLLIIALVTPLFYSLGLRRELRIIEQILAISLIFISIEVFIFLMPFIIGSIKSLF